MPRRARRATPPDVEHWRETLGWVWTYRPGEQPGSADLVDERGRRLGLVRVDSAGVWAWEMISDDRAVSGALSPTIVDARRSLVSRVLLRWLNDLPGWAIVDDALDRKHAERLVEVESSGWTRVEFVAELRRDHRGPDVWVVVGSDGWKVAHGDQLETALAGFASAVMLSTTDELPPAEEPGPDESLDRALLARTRTALDEF